MMPSSLVWYNLPAHRTMPLPKYKSTHKRHALHLLFLAEVCTLLFSLGILHLSDGKLYKGKSACDLYKGASWTVPGLLTASRIVRKKAYICPLALALYRYRNHLEMQPNKVPNIHQTPMLFRTHAKAR